MNGFSPASPSPGKDAESEQPGPGLDLTPAIPTLTQPAGRNRTRLGRAIEFVLFSRWIERGCRYLLGAVFLLASISKIIDLPGFIDHLTLHSPLSVPVARVLAAFLPWLELTCAFCLFLNVFGRESAAILAVLLVLFIGYDFLIPAEANCGCFLLPRIAANSTVFSRSVPRNLILLAFAVRICIAAPIHPRPNCDVRG
jgi:DoxX